MPRGPRCQFCPEAQCHPMLTLCCSALSQFDPFSDLSHSLPLQKSVWSAHGPLWSPRGCTHDSLQCPLWCVISLFASNLKARLAKRRVNVQPCETKPSLREPALSYYDTFKQMLKDYNLVYANRSQVQDRSCRSGCKNFAHEYFLCFSCSRTVSGL